MRASLFPGVRVLTQAHTLDLEWLVAVWVPVGRGGTRVLEVGRDGARDLGRDGNRVLGVGRDGARTQGVGRDRACGLEVR